MTHPCTSCGKLFERADLCGYRLPTGSMTYVCEACLEAERRPVTPSAVRTRPEGEPS